MNNPPYRDWGPTANQRGKVIQTYLYIIVYKKYLVISDKARHIVPTALLVRVQRFRKDLCKAVKGLITRLIVLSMITVSYWRRRRRFTIFERRDEIASLAFDPPLFVDKITVGDTEVDSFWYIYLKLYCTKFGQTFRGWPKEFPNDFRSLWYM